MNTNLVTLIPQFINPTTSVIIDTGTLETYVAGTSTTLATYPTNTDAVAGTNANSTSITITNGYPKSGGNVIGVFCKPGKQYKFILKDSSGTTLWTLDNISNLTDSIVDANGNEVMKFVAVASAVNEITVTNAATGNSPTIAASGDDNNINVTVKPKGNTGSTILADGNGNEVLKTATTGSAVNEITVTNAATGNNPQFSATGGDTNIGVDYLTKGTGQHTFKYEDTRTDSVAAPLIVRGTTSGTPTAGIGVGILHQAESADENPSNVGQTQFAFSDVTAGSEDSYFEILTKRAGAALATAYRWIVTSAFKYIFTGAPTADRTWTLPDCDISEFVVQKRTHQIQGATQSTTFIPGDTSIPQNTEGTEIFTKSITPKKSTHKLYFTVTGFLSTVGASDTVTIALFQDSTANAIASGFVATSAVDLMVSFCLTYEMDAGTTNATTFKVRIGGTARTVNINGTSSANQGGTVTSSLRIEERTA